MLKKAIRCLFVLNLISVSAFSNYSLFPGYYITKSGDTIRCSIEFGDWNRNPKTVHLTINNESKDFSPSDIKGFGVDGYVDYVSATITYHIAPADDYPSEFTDSTATISCFLKTLVSGRYSLYFLFSSQKNYFFYNRPGGSVSELIYRVRMSEGKLEEDQSYRRQIFNLFESEEITSKYVNRINYARYNSTDFTSLFSALNGNRNTIRKNRNSSLSLEPEIFLGVIRNIFPTTFDGDYLKQIQADPYITISGGLNLLLSFPGIFKSLKAGAGVGYNKYEITINKSWTTDYSYTGTQYTTNYHENITARSLMLFGNFYLMWVANPLSKIQAYIKAGGSYHFALNNDRDITTSYTTSTQGTRNGIPFEETNQQHNTLIKPKGGYVSFIGSAGITYGRHSLELSYRPPVNIVGQVQNPRIQNSFKTGSMSLYYYFSLTTVKN